MGVSVTIVMITPSSVKLMLVIILLISFPHTAIKPVAIALVSSSSIIVFFAGKTENFPWLDSHIIVKLLASVLYEVSFIAFGMYFVGPIRPFEHLGFVKLNNYCSFFSLCALNPVHPQPMMAFSPCLHSTSTFFGSD